MIQEHAGFMPTTQGRAVYAGRQGLINGRLDVIHEHSYVQGYSALMSPDGTKQVMVKYGIGVFYDNNKKENVVYAGAPTTTGAVPVFAGILKNMQGNMTSKHTNPMVAGMQNKAQIIAEGYVSYDMGFVGAGTTEELLINNANIKRKTTKAYVSSTDGHVYFGTAKNQTSDVMAGVVVGFSPDERSIKVHISPVYSYGIDA